MLPAFCIQLCPLLAAEDFETLIPLSSISMNAGWLTGKHAGSQTPVGNQNRNQECSVWNLYLLSVGLSISVSDSWSADGED